MPRLIVLWSRPYHLATEEAERWAREQVAELVRAGGVDGAVLTRLASATARQHCDWDWLLELEIAPPVRDRLDEWLGDLRLLGSRPVAVLAGDTIPLGDA